MCDDERTDTSLFMLKDMESCRTPSVCTPEKYYCSEFQSWMRRRRSEQLWIDCILAGGESLLRHSTFTLCHHQSNQGQVVKDRFVIFFTDRTLLTIREPTVEHKEMLEHASYSVRWWLKDHGFDADLYTTWFNYMPSAFQLHCHVAPKAALAEEGSCRVHLLQEVLDNLSLNPDYYKHASIITSFRHVQKSRRRRTNRLAEQEPKLLLNQEPDLC